MLVSLVRWASANISVAHVLLHALAAGVFVVLNILLPPREVIYIGVGAIFGATMMFMHTCLTLRGRHDRR